MWLNYGWFSGLMCLGSVFGAMTWGAYMGFLVEEFTASSTPLHKSAQFRSLVALSEYWACAFYATYAVEFLCVSVVKLLVLDRMADFAVPEAESMSRHLAVGGRVVMAVVVLGNVVGLCANVAAAALSKEIGDFDNAASAASAANNTDAYLHFIMLKHQKNDGVKRAASVQQFSEITVLLIVIVAFAVVGIAGARRLSSILRSMSDEHGVAGRQLRRQIAGTAAFVLVTCLLHAVFAVMNAVSAALQKTGSDCTSICDSTCHNVWEVMQWWIAFTPEFQLSVMLISSPLALLVALWGMTSELTLQLMQSSQSSKQQVQSSDLDATFSYEGSMLRGAGTQDSRGSGTGSGSGASSREISLNEFGRPAL